MKKIILISLASILLVCGCKEIDELDFVDDSQTESSIVTVLDNGKISVLASISASDMTDISVSTRASDDFETVINSGWCLIFGEDKTNYDDDSISDYSDDSPLLMKIPIERNANGTFFINFDCYDGVGFLRIVTNLTQREEENLEDAKAWGDDPANYEDREEGAYVISYLKDFDYDAADVSSYATFGTYKYQSVGIDGIYNLENYITTINYDEFTTDVNGVISYAYNNINTTEQPNPDLSNLSSDIPMSSIGFAFNNGINATTLNAMFMTQIYMIRVCSKMDVTISDSQFALSEVYMIDCAQESRLRSTVLSTAEDTDDSYASTTGNTFGIPVDLGGAIDYLPLTYTSALTSGSTTDPIYFYPNAGGNYSSDGYDEDEKVNPQYVIVKGRAGGYDTDGYYKIALKAQYPLTYKYDGDVLAVDSDGNYIVETYTDLTYDILRNTYFNINLLNVDKPGYKTLADAMDENSPACNISYSITILTNDSRNEILVSNGTYYVELNTTRVYMAGYGQTTLGDAGGNGDITFTIYPNSSDGGYYHPAVYVQADYGVSVDKVIANGSTVTEIDLDDSDIVKALFTEGSDYYDSEIAAAYSDADAFVAEFAADDEVHNIWYKVKSSNSDTEVTVNFSASESGRIRLRIGDMLKFIPVRYTSSVISYNADTLSIGEAGISFAYDKIVALNDTDVSWFASDGIVEANSGATEREINAMIYPTNTDGIAKLYFIQAASTDTDVREDQTTNPTLLSGNVIYLDGNTTLGVSEYKSYSTVLAEAEDILDAGYTTIYINGSYDSELFFSNGKDDETNYASSIYTALTNYIDTAKDDDGNLLYDEDFLYSICMEDSDSKGSATIDDLKQCFFYDNDRLYSVTLPSSLVKIDENAFSECDNLEYVIVGSQDNVSTDFNSIVNNAFKNCPALKMVKIYTKKTVSTDSGFSGTTTVSNTKTSSSNNVWIFGTELNVD